MDVILHIIQTFECKSHFLEVFTDKHGHLGNTALIFSKGVQHTTTSFVDIYLLYTTPEKSLTLNAKRYLEILNSIPLTLSLANV